MRFWHASNWQYSPGRAIASYTTAPVVYRLYFCQCATAPAIFAIGLVNLNRFTFYEILVLTAISPIIPFLVWITQASAEHCIAFSPCICNLWQTCNSLLLCFTQQTCMCNTCMLCKVCLVCDTSVIYLCDVHIVTQYPLVSGELPHASSNHPFPWKLFIWNTLVWLSDFRYLEFVDCEEMCRIFAVQSRKRGGGGGYPCWMGKKRGRCLWGL